MGPREQDNSLLLLSAVTVICGLIAFVPWLMEPTPALAGRSPERMVQQSPVSTSALAPARVIVPFTPNTTPANR
jgi:hypothetical protein